MQTCHSIRGSPINLSSMHPHSAPLNIPSICVYRVSRQLPLSVSLCTLSTAYATNLSKNQKEEERERTRAGRREGWKNRRKDEERKRSKEEGRKGGSEGRKERMERENEGAQEEGKWGAITPTHIFLLLSIHKNCRCLHFFPSVTPHSTVKVVVLVKNVWISTKVIYLWVRNWLWIGDWAHNFFWSMNTAPSF